MWKSRTMAGQGTFLLLAASALLTLLSSGVAWADSQSIHKQFTTDFNLAACTFSATGRNTFFSIDPDFAPMNHILLEGEDKKELVQLEITILNETFPVELNVLGLGTVVTRVVEEMEWVDGELVEVSDNYFALCEETGSVYYFGEDVTIYEYDDEGNLTDTVTGVEAGSWLAGMVSADGETYNQPGLIMPGTFLLGSRYYQEIAPDIALDRAENIEMDLTLETPAGSYANSVKTEETSPLEPSAKDIKIYAPNVGLIVDVTIQRVTAFSEP